MRAGKDTAGSQLPFLFLGQELPGGLEMGVLGECVDTLTVPRSQMRAQRPRTREHLSNPKPLHHPWIPGSPSTVEGRIGRWGMGGKESGLEALPACPILAPVGLRVECPAVLGCGAFRVKIQTVPGQLQWLIALTEEVGLASSQSFSSCSPFSSPPQPSWEAQPFLLPSLQALPPTGRPIPPQLQQLNPPEAPTPKRPHSC